ncbi:MAG: hypothetical protein NPIRA01_38560 [Nitrospirales bacterium]|nr:MAG: hypothetical protein NPIRA01_38560 [Nitrospirales bacterium]
MSAQTLALAFHRHLETYGLSSTLGAQIPYGQKLVIQNAATPSRTYTVILYDGKKGPRIVFEGPAWPDELQHFVQTVWNAFQNISTDGPEKDLANNHDQVIIYVDGSYQDANGTPCVSWAFEVWQAVQSLHADSGVLTDASVLSSRNVAGECEAVRQGLTWAHSHGHHVIEVRYDYMGVAAWPTGSWKAKLPFTQQYAQDIRKLAKQLSISWKHVRGHRGEPGNERVDRLARATIASHF